MLAERGDDPVRVLGLGPLYRRLRRQLDELRVPAGSFGHREQVAAVLAASSSRA